MDNCNVPYEFCKNCFINCLQIIRKPDPFYTVKCPCFNILNLEMVERRIINEN